MAIVVDTTLATLQFFVIKRIATSDERNMTLFLGYTLGGVAGTVTGIYLSLYIMGR